jgi:hypothetical protein
MFYHQSIHVMKMQIFQAPGDDNDNNDDEYIEYNAKERMHRNAYVYKQFFLFFIRIDYPLCSSRQSVDFSTAKVIDIMRN